MPSTVNTGHSGLGDIREKIIDLEHQFCRLKGDFEMRVAIFMGEMHALRSHGPFVDFWADVRKIEKSFHWAQGSYHMRILNMRAVIAGCKRQMQISCVSCYSGVNNGGSLSAPRY